MRIDRFMETLGLDFFTGVPDSQLKALCDCLMETYGIDPQHHIIAANEGNCAAIAAGYHLATGRTPVVYMQNSGEGNVINPVASLLNDHVYAIPALFIIGWRGEPGIHDEPQHIYQGKVTLSLLDELDISYFVLDDQTTTGQLCEVMDGFRRVFRAGKQAAIVVRKGGLTFDKKVKYANDNAMKREEIIRHIVAVSQHDPIVSTTGKASRELFEIREQLDQGHENDFLTVGSMGHASSIALGVAIQKPTTKVWCIDGDGAALMHMGSLALIGTNAPGNLVHIVINNAAHETVGGMPTVAGQIDLAAVCKACGYPNTVKVRTFEELDSALREAKESKTLCFIEAACSIGARADLGRPTTSAIENKEHFMQRLSREKAGE